MKKVFYVRTIKSGMYASRKENGTYSLETNFKRGREFTDVERAKKVCQVLNNTFTANGEVFEIVQEIRRS